MEKGKKAPVARQILEEVKVVKTPPVVKGAYEIQKRVTQCVADLRSSYWKF